jgi:hypothetical protein
MNKTVLNYINKCEGWKTAIKQLHWDSDNMSQHKLCDDVADRLSDFQDQIGEVEQSITGKLKINSLKPTAYTVVNLRKFIEDVLDDTNNFLKEIREFGDTYIGMASDCESFISDMQRNLYLTNFTMKEDFKRSYKNKINESKSSGNKKIKISEGELRKVISEAVCNIFSGKNINESCSEAEVAGGDYCDKELNYTHFAVNKVTNLIVDGWDYTGYDTEDLKSNKNDYFYCDLIDSGFNPTAYKILSFKACNRNGINPNDNNNWSNTGVFPLRDEIEMQKSGKNPYDKASKQHPDWFK